MCYQPRILVDQDCRCLVGVPFMYSSCTKQRIAPWWLTAGEYYICPPLSCALIWVLDYITFFFFCHGRMWCCIYGLQLKSKRASMLHDEVCLQPSEKVILSLISPRLTVLSNRSIDIRKSLSFLHSESVNCGVIFRF